MLPEDEIERIMWQIISLRQPHTNKIIFNRLEAYKLAIVAYRYQHPDFDDEQLV